MSLASEIKAAYEAVSPFIEKHTSTVCPACERVCCMDRHAAPEPEDMAFFEAIMLEDPSAALPSLPPRQLDTETCRHMGPLGCGLERWQRPFRCTWFFCDALLERMPREDARAYRVFVAGLGRLVELRGRLVAALGAQRP